MHQPVQWLPWGTEAFARAAAEDKLVLLDIGAVWCHWCHVMDGESYEDPETAALINDHFIAIKVDRDERPDVDARYQAAVAAISGQGGWPLTAFLTPEGKPFFGGTYFPREERYGQPSFQRVLRTMAASFYERRADVEESAGSVMEAIEYGENFAGPRGDLQQDSAVRMLQETMVGTILQLFDGSHGGFGSQPKFPNAVALDLLLDATGHGGKHAWAAGDAALHTLHAMARGGICDQLAGGFYRYAVDQQWRVPHFEKMLYDNAALLSSYIHAVQVFDDPECATTAGAILDWMDGSLSDQENGGFYAAHCADVSPADDGSYYTWSISQAAQVLTGQELDFARAYFGIDSVGDMARDPTQNVLSRSTTPQAAAQRAGVDPEAAVDLLKVVTNKLRRARELRPTPLVDRTMYTAWNGLAITAYVQAGRVLQRPGALTFAQATADRVLATAFDNGFVNHVVSYAEAQSPQAAVPGMLDDHVLFALACVDLWEATGEIRYLHAAEQIAAVLLNRFFDDREGGFFDTASANADTLGALVTRRKPVQDAPTSAGNPAAATLLLRLHAFTGTTTYRDSALRTLESFAGVMEHLGLNGASSGLALGRVAPLAVDVVVVGDGSRAALLESVALAGSAVSRSVLWLRQSQRNALPEALAQHLMNMPTGEEPVAFVCVGGHCIAPLTEPEALRVALQRRS